MHPVLFQIGEFKVYSFGMLILAGFIGAYLFASARAPKYGLTKDNLGDVLIGALLFGILGARIAYILLDLPHFIQNPKELLTLQFQGLTSFGGLIAGAAFVIVYTRRAKASVLAMGDTLAPPLLIAHALGRVGCFLNGCCYGGVCELPWGIPVRGLPGLHHPAQLYDTAMTLVGMGLVLLYERTRPLPGRVLAATVMAYGVSRFIYEFWRMGASSKSSFGLPLTDAQLAAVLMTAFGALLFAWYGRRARAQESQLA